MNNANEEIEVVFLDVDKDALETQLSGIGAEKVRDFFYRHAAFDFPDYRLDKDNSWTRLRDEGDVITLAYKKRLGVTSQDGSTNDEGMEEIEITVSDYKKTAELLKKLGLIEKHEAEKKRARWQKEGITFDIDTWPAVPTFLEIEASTWEEIDKATEELGLNPAERKICSASQIYQLYGFEVNDYQKLCFDGLVKKDL